MVYKFNIQYRTGNNMYSVIIQYISFTINMKSRPTNMFVVIKPLNKIIILAIYIGLTRVCKLYTAELRRVRCV